jgi:hypothetical protein
MINGWRGVTRNARNVMRAGGYCAEGGCGLKRSPAISRFRAHCQSSEDPSHGVAAITAEATRQESSLPPSTLLNGVAQLVERQALIALAGRWFESSRRSLVLFFCQLLTRISTACRAWPTPSRRKTTYRAHNDISWIRIL